MQEIKLTTVQQRLGEYYSSHDELTGSGGILLWKT
jgi:hypothetical protein